MRSKLIEKHLTRHVSSTNLFHSSGFVGVLTAVVSVQILRFILLARIVRFYWVFLQNFNLLRTGGKYWTEYLSSASIFSSMRVRSFRGFVFMMIVQLKLDMAPNVHYLKLHATKYCFASSSSSFSLFLFWCA